MLFQGNFLSQLQHAKRYLRVARKTGGGRKKKFHPEKIRFTKQADGKTGGRFGFRKKKAGYFLYFMNWASRASSWMRSLAPSTRRKLYSPMTSTNAIFVLESSSASGESMSSRYNWVMTSSPAIPYSYKRVSSFSRAGRNWPESASRMRSLISSGRARLETSYTVFSSIAFPMAAEACKTLMLFRMSPCAT